MTRIYHNSFRWAMVSLAVALVAGCVGTTKVEPSHPLMGATVESTRVYFIRPKSGFRGVADRPLTITLDGKKLLALSKGQYTLLALASGTFEMKVDSYTVMANGAMTSASTKVPVTFSKGQTQYLTFDIISGGYTYAPFTLSKERAVEVVQQLTPIGMAVKEPITQH
jgi:hypothetical protein